MIGIDANVLVRTIVEERSDQARRARALLAAAQAAGTPIRIDWVVLCEAVWVLQRSYRASRDAVAQVVDALLATPALEIEARDAVEEALERFRDGATRFTDALIGATNRRAGCRATYSFDRRAVALPDFAPVPEG